MTETKRSYRCLSPVVDDDGRHDVGEVIELTGAQGAPALVATGAIELVPAPQPKTPKKAGTKRATS